MAVSARFSVAGCLINLEKTSYKKKKAWTNTMFNHEIMNIFLLNSGTRQTQIQFKTVVETVTRINKWSWMVARYKVKI